MGPFRTRAVVVSTKYRQHHQAPGLLVHLRGDGHYYRVVEESHFDLLKEIGAHV